MAERDALGYDGSVIGDRYEVEKHLGRGSYANVYIVKDKQERLIRKAMKIIDIGHEVGNVDGDEQTFVTEHELMKGLHHPNIFSLCDSFIIKDNFYLVTEYCQGGDLDRYLGRCKDQDQKLEKNQVTKWIKQILQAVEYIHERDIIHRDIKPRNILLQDGAVKLGDFGVARNVGSAGLANTIVGTICYLSPEVLKHDGYNTKFDIWSVGCVLYEMVTFKRAFDGSNLMTALFRIVEGKIPEWPRGYSPHLQDVFTRALTMEHTERPSALELLQILDDPDGRTLERDIEGLIIGDTRSESTESEERSITEETCHKREYFHPLECGKDTDESEMSRVPLGRDDEEQDHEMVSDSIDSLPVRPPRKSRGLPVERQFTPSVTVKQPDSEDVTLIANCVVKQKPDDPGLIYVDCCLKTKIPQLMEELRHQGYTKGPMPSKDVHLKHYEEIIVTSKGGIKLNLDHEGREEFVFVFDSRSDRNGQEGWICSKDHSGAASMGFVFFSVKRYNAEDGSFHMETLCSLPVSISGTLCEPPIVQQNTGNVVTHAGPSLSATDGGHPEEFWNPVVAITRALGDNWMGLARELHYGTVNIGHFQQQSDNGSTDAIVTMLMDWFRRTREMSDKIGQLTEALLNAGHKDVANEIIQREANARSEKNFQLAVETMVEDAHLLNDWQVFLRTLGLSDADILMIEFNQKIPNLKNLVRQGVSLWRKKEGMEEASVSKLVECLENINNKRLAEKISEYCGC